MLDSKWILLTGFIVVGCAETFQPLRALPTSTARRWASNLVLYGAAWLVSIAAIPVAGVLLASALWPTTFASAIRLHLPYAAQFLIAFLLLDFSSYVLHRLFHAFGFAWRVHQVHHSETEMDLTTGLRFHPIEALASQVLWLVTVALIGAPPAAVALSAAANIIQDFVQHANWHFPERADRALRLLIASPGMHRIHHSTATADYNKNFGTILSLWDRMFGTYRVPNSDRLEYGLDNVPNGSALDPWRLILLPFRRHTEAPLTDAVGLIDRVAGQ